MALYNVAKFVFLFLAVMWSIVNVGRFLRGQSIEIFNIVMQSVGVAGFVYMQWIL